jgi:ABC-type nitrate/sulfonate/bicarbonate transport system substrate-binding protein
MNDLRCVRLALLAAGLALACPWAPAEEPFAKKVGDVKVGSVKPADAYDLPFLTWGGDVATFLANGGDKLTRRATLFDQQGVKVNLVNGDDFTGQVKNYLAGKTPYIRGTMSQLGQASEVLGRDPKTQPVVFLQLTWSAGDHMVARPSCKILNDLKGKKIALQYGGPHVGMLDDVLRSASLKWADVKVIWTDDVTGAKGPAELFRKDPSVDACFVITPDMLELTSGGKVGTGAEKSVKGAKVLVSTVTLSHSIADVYACRKDFYDKHKDVLEKLTAAYLKGCEQLVEMRRNHDETDKKDKELDKKYKGILEMTQAILGKEAVPDLDAAHGLISDATFVGLPGNYAFFKDAQNPVNFQNRAKAAVDLAVNEGYAPKRIDLAAADLNYEHIKGLGKLALDVRPPAVKPPSAEDQKPGEIDLDKDTVYFFTVQFESDGAEVDRKRYEKEFEKAIEAAALYGNSMIMVRGHVDPTKTLAQFVQAGLRSGALRRVKEGDEYKYFAKGKPLDLADTKKVLELIKGGDDFLDKDEPDKNPRVTVEAANKLSDQRAKAVRESITELAQTRGVRLSPNQFKSEGVGIAEPVIGKPRNADQAALNRRVEFRIIKIAPERLTKKDFDF